MKRSKMSEKQFAIYAEIESFIAKHKYPPSVRELAAAFNIQSPSTIHSYLRRLKDHGLIGWEPNSPRTLHIIEQK